MLGGPTDIVDEGGVMLQEPGIDIGRENIAARACLLVTLLRGKWC